VSLSPDKSELFITQIKSMVHNLSKNSYRKNKNLLHIAHDSQSKVTLNQFRNCINVILLNIIIKQINHHVSSVQNYNHFM